MHPLPVTEPPPHTSSSPPPTEALTGIPPRGPIDPSTRGDPANVGGLQPTVDPDASTPASIADPYQTAHAQQAALANEAAARKVDGPDDGRPEGDEPLRHAGPGPGTGGVVMGISVDPSAAGQAGSWDGVGNGGGDDEGGGASDFAGGDGSRDPFAGGILSPDPASDGLLPADPFEGSGATFDPSAGEGSTSDPPLGSGATADPSAGSDPPSQPPTSGASADDSPSTSSPAGPTYPDPADDPPRTSAPPEDPPTASGPAGPTDPAPADAGSQASEPGGSGTPGAGIAGTAGEIPGSSLGAVPGSEDQGGAHGDGGSGSGQLGPVAPSTDQNDPADPGTWVDQATHDPVVTPPSPPASVGEPDIMAPLPPGSLDPDPAIVDPPDHGVVWETPPGEIVSQAQGELGEQLQEIASGGVSGEKGWMDILGPAMMAVGAATLQPELVGLGAGFAVWVEDNPGAAEAVDAAKAMGAAGVGVMLDLIDSYKAAYPDGYVFPPSAGLPPAQEPGTSVGPDPQSEDGTPLVPAPHGSLDGGIPSGPPAVPPFEPRGLGPGDYAPSAGMPPAGQPMTVGPDPGGSGGVPVDSPPPQQNLAPIGQAGSEDADGDRPPLSLDELVALSRAEDTFSQWEDGKLPLPAPPGADPDSMAANTLTPEEQEQGTRAYEQALRLQGETEGMSPAEKAMFEPRAQSELASHLTHDEPENTTAGQEAIESLQAQHEQWLIQQQIERDFRDGLNE
jgi:hypothetical protein